jgi:predicted Holliday junction resolvase-like endonuclease
VQRTSTKKNRHVADPRWWDAPVDLSKYDGMTQGQIHKSIQIEWADFKKRAGIN